MVDILLDKMSSGNLISFDTLLQWSFNPQTEILCETQTNLTFKNIVIIYQFNLLNNHDVMVLCNILLLVSTCGQRSDYLSAGETFQSKEQKLAQFKMAQNKNSHWGARALWFGLLKAQYMSRISTKNYYSGATGRLCCCIVKVFCAT